jgi:hypothetical protein
MDVHVTMPQYTGILDAMTILLFEYYYSNISLYFQKVNDRNIPLRRLV